MSINLLTPQWGYAEDLSGMEVKWVSAGGASTASAYWNAGTSVSAKELIDGSFAIAPKVIDSNKPWLMIKLPGGGEATTRGEPLLLCGPSWVTTQTSYLYNIYLAKGESDEMTTVTPTANAGVAPVDIAYVDRRISYRYKYMILAQSAAIGTTELVIPTTVTLPSRYQITSTVKITNGITDITTLSGRISRMASGTPSIDASYKYTVDSAKAEQLSLFMKRLNARTSKYEILIDNLELSQYPIKMICGTGPTLTQTSRDTWDFEVSGRLNK